MVSVGPEVDAVRGRSGERGRLVVSTAEAEADDDDSMVGLWLGWLWWLCCIWCRGVLLTAAAAEDDADDDAGAEEELDLENNRFIMIEINRNEWIEWLDEWMNEWFSE